MAAGHSLAQVKPCALFLRHSTCSEPRPLPWFYQVRCGEFANNYAMVMSSLKFDVVVTKAATCHYFSLGAALNTCHHLIGDLRKECITMTNSTQQLLSWAPGVSIVHVYRPPDSLNIGASRCQQSRNKNPAHASKLRATAETHQLEQGLADRPTLSTWSDSPVTSERTSASGICPISTPNHEMSAN